MANYMLKSNSKLRKKRIKSSKTPILEMCPQKRGSCLKVFVASPRKPNSAARRVAKVILTSNRRVSIAYCPGEGHTLQKHSAVLIRGGRTKDLPGVKYKMLRGKFDLKLVHGRMNGRSKYGT